MAQKIVRIDGIKWWITKSTQNVQIAIPLCPDHNLRMTEPWPDGRIFVGRTWRDRRWGEAKSLDCAEGPHSINIPRELEKEKKYVLDRIDAKIFEGMETIDLDGELTPVAKAKDKSDKYFATAQIMDSKRGPQVVVYAGEKGKEKKTQLFIDPKNKKLSFDHKDIDPSDTFLEIKATFDDGSSHTIEQKRDKK